MEGVGGEVNGNWVTTGHKEHKRCSFTGSEQGGNCSLMFLLASVPGLLIHLSYSCVRYQKLQTVFTATDLKRSKVGDVLVLPHV